MLRSLVWWFCWGVSLCACQPQAGKTPALPASELKIQLELPKKYSPESQGYRWLIENGAYLSFQLKSKEGFERREVFPSHHWAAICLSDLEFPSSLADWLEIKVEGWLNASPDRPILSGHARFLAKDLDGDGQALLHIKLRSLGAVAPWR